MPQAAFILVRIAVGVPQGSALAPFGIESIICPHCGEAHDHPADDAPPCLPGVTVEMAAFYREHPDNN
jgi:hypothetical protein